MKIILALLLIITANLTCAQEFTVNNFSKNYYGKINIENTNEVFSKGWIAIFDRKNKELIKVVSEELALSLHDGQVIANINELPYGEQSLIMYSDFNFDGKKDFAIEDGQNSGYHLPSFAIYLADQNGFVYSEDFTRLAQEYLGMFEVNSEEKKISTTKKDGCCWHQYSEFIVENNKPKVIKIIEDDRNHFPYIIDTEEILNDKKMVKTSKKSIDLNQDSIKVVLSFKIAKNDKQVVLFTINDTTLSYALIQKNGNVEFSYPFIEDNFNTSPEDFKFDTTQANRSISFVNKNASYRIYENSDKKVGIKIEVNGKISDWIGAEETKEGSLEKLLNVKWDNVVLQ